jgi:hypothetical protein
MSKLGLWAIAGVFLVTMLYLVYAAATFEAPEGTTTVVLEPTASEPEAPSSPSPVRPSATERQTEQDSDDQDRELPETIFRQQPAAPAVVTADGASEVEVAPTPEEVEIAEPEATAAQSRSIDLPSLNRSDSFVLDALRGLQNGAAVVSLLADDQLIRKFVVFVENVSRLELPQTGLPYQALGEDMPARNIDENLYVMDSSAHSRFDSVVDTFVSVDTSAALAVYRLLSPLFQQAYAEIGFRDVSFDDTLRRALNNVLQAQQVEGPFQLVKPSVMFLYADASIENLNTIEKQLIRLGPENSERLKTKLRDFVSRL